MSKRLEKGQSGATPDCGYQGSAGRPRRASLSCRHTTPEKFRHGQPLKIELVVEKPVAVRLYYRHVNQAERWESVEMQAPHGRYSATLPGKLHGLELSAQYYFELKQGPDIASLYPGFAADLTNSPISSCAARDNVMDRLDKTKQGTRSTK